MYFKIGLRPPSKAFTDFSLLEIGSGIPGFVFECLTHLQCVIMGPPWVSSRDRTFLLNAMIGLALLGTP